MSDSEMNQAQNKEQKKEKSERIIAILTWIIVLLIVLYSGLYVGKLEKEAEFRKKNAAALKQENVALGSNFDSEYFLIRVHDFKNESETIDFISDNLGFKYLKPIQISPDSPERCVDIGFFRSEQSAFEISKKYELQGKKCRVINFRDKDCIGLNDAPVSKNPDSKPSDPKNEASKTLASKTADQKNTDVKALDKEKNTFDHDGIKKSKSSDLPQNGNTEFLNKSVSIGTDNSDNKNRGSDKEIITDTDIEPSAPVNKDKKDLISGISKESAHTSDINILTKPVKNKVIQSGKTGNDLDKIIESGISGSFWKSSHTKITDPAVLKNMFTIQVLSLTNKNSALAVAEKIKKAGFHVYITDNGKPENVFRVRIGAFKTREDANKIKKEIIQVLKEFSGGYVLHGVLKK
jgi:hypothetical protein